MGIFSSLIGIVAIICAIWVIYDVVVNMKKMKTGEKVIWIVCAILFSIITAIVYYVIKKK